MHIRLPSPTTTIATTTTRRTTTSTMTQGQKRQQRHKLRQQKQQWQRSCFVFLFYLFLVWIFVVENGSSSCYPPFINNTRIIIVRRLMRRLLMTVGRGLFVMASSEQPAQYLDTVIGIVGRDFVVLGADSALTGRGMALTCSHNVDKIAILTNPFPQDDCTDDNNNNNLNEQQQELQELYLDKQKMDEEEEEQPIVAAAVVGNPAHVDELIQNLRAMATIHEYEAGVGCDVEFVDSTTTPTPPTTMKKNPTAFGLSNSFPSSSSSSRPPFLGHKHGNHGGGGGSGRSSVGLSVHDLAQLARSKIYERLRTENRYQVSLLVAGLMPEQQQQYKQQEEQSKPLMTAAAIDDQNDMDRRNNDNNNNDDDDDFFSSHSSSSSRLQHQIRVATQSLSSTKTWTEIAVDKKDMVNNNDLQQQQQEEQQGNGDERNLPQPEKQEHSSSSSSWQSNNNQESSSSSSSSSSAAADLYDDDNSSNSNYYHPYLYWLDEYGSLQQLTDYGVQGMASSLIWSILDQQYYPQISLSDAIQLINHCFAILRQRYLINHHTSSPCIKYITTRTSTRRTTSNTTTTLGGHRRHCGRPVLFVVPSTTT